MQVSVEATSKIERRLTVVVPVNTLEEAYDKRITKLAKTVKVDGFRPGKVPLDYVKNRFGDSARKEALGEVIQSSLYAAINQEKLSPVGVPTVEPKAIMPGAPLEYVAIFEVVPTLDAVRFEAPILEKQTATITEADIDTVLERLRTQYVKWQKVDRAAQDKDQVVIDFSGAINGKLFEGGQAHDYPIVLGSKTMIPGFEEGLLGAKAGEERIVPVTFAANYFAKEVAGKSAEFTIKVHKVSCPDYPTIDEAFIKKLGVKSGNLEEFRAEIRKNLERELERFIKSKMKTQVFDKLLEQNPIDVPKALIEQEAKRVHDEMHPHHKGHDHNHSEAEMGQFNEIAKRNVALGLIVAELIKQHKITPNKERIKAQITSISSAYENPQEILKWYATNKRGIAEVEMQVLEEQVMEKLLESTQVKEKVLSYNELIGA